MKILAIDFGTYCDWKIMASIVRRLVRDGQDVYYVTDNDNKIGKEVGAHILSYYRTPLMKKEMSDSQSELFKLSDMQAIKLSFRARLNMFRFIMHVRSIIFRFLKSNTVDMIIFHYPALLFHLAIPIHVLMHIPVLVIYVAPAFPTRTLPWIFSGLFKDPKYRIYSKSYREVNEAEHQMYMEKISGWRTKDGFYIFRRKDFMEYAMRNHFTLVQAWDPLVLPAIHSEVPTKMVGSITERDHLARLRSMSYKAAGATHSKMLSFLQSNRVWYCSLGTFSVNLHKLIPALIRSARKHKLKVIFHDTSDELKNSQLKHDLINHPDIHITSQFLLHEWLVPKCRCVLTTGSVCLVNLCYYYEKPMLFMPILHEQYFWAKNYKYFCGVAPILENSKIPISQQLGTSLRQTFVIKKSQVKSYLKRVSASMRRRDGIANISRLVKEISSTPKAVADRNSPLTAVPVADA